MAAYAEKPPIITGENPHVIEYHVVGVTSERTNGKVQYPMDPPYTSLGVQAMNLMCVFQFGPSARVATITDWRRTRKTPEMLPGQRAWIIHGPTTFTPVVIPIDGTPITYHASPVDNPKLFRQTDNHEDLTQSLDCGAFEVGNELLYRASVLYQQAYDQIKVTGNPCILENSVACAAPVIVEALP